MNATSNSEINHEPPGPCCFLLIIYLAIEQWQQKATRTKGALSTDEALCLSSLLDMPLLSD